MAEIINLRLARKARARADAQTQAAANRALHGTTRADRQRQREEAARLATHVDGHKLESE